MYQPDFSVTSQLLNHLTNDELKDVLNDDEKIEDLLKDIQELKDLDKEKEMLIVNNKSLAEFNLSKEPQLIEGRENIKELASEGQKLCQSINEKHNSMKSKTSKVSLEGVLNELQAAAAQMEAKSEDIAEKFLSNDMDIEQFLELFATDRKLMHLRKVKVDKMKELMKKRSSTGASLHNYNNLPNNSFYPPVVSNVPYPTGDMNMQMPGAGYFRY